MSVDDSVTIENVPPDARKECPVEYVAHRIFEVDEDANHNLLYRKYHRALHDDLHDGQQDVGALKAQPCLARVRILMTYLEREKHRGEHVLGNIDGINNVDDGACLLWRYESRVSVAMR